MTFYIENFYLNTLLFGLECSGDLLINDQYIPKFSILLDGLFFVSSKDNNQILCEPKFLCNFKLIYRNYQIN